jgi:hypothetical protein
VLNKSKTAAVIGGKWNVKFLMLDFEWKDEEAASFFSFPITNYKSPITLSSLFPFATLAVNHSSSKSRNYRAASPHRQSAGGIWPFSCAWTFKLAIFAYK